MDWNELLLGPVLYNIFFWDWREITNDVTCFTPFFFTLPSWREADNCQMMFKCKPPAPRSLSNPSVEKERVTHFVGPTWSENRHGTARATLVLIAPRADEDLLIKKNSINLKVLGKVISKNLTALMMQPVSVARWCVRHEESRIINDD